MDYEIREVSSSTEQRAIYAFRYSIYVAEMRRSQRYADHRHRLVFEPADNSARLLAAFDCGGDIVGTVRVHLRRDTPTEYQNWYRMQAFGDFHPDQTSITTKLMIASSFRGSSLVIRLSQACCELAVREGVSFNFIDCNDRLAPFFNRLGYRQVFANFHHPEYGLVKPMVIAMYDVHHLREVTSPFTRIVPPVSHPSVDFFHRLLRTNYELTGA